MGDFSDIGYSVIAIGLGTLMIVFGLRKLLYSFILSLGEKFKVTGTIIENGIYNNENSRGFVKQMEAERYVPVYEFSHPKHNGKVKFRGTNNSDTKFELGTKKELSIVIYKDRLFDVQENRLLTTKIIPVVVLLSGILIVIVGAVGFFS